MSDDRLYGDYPLFADPFHALRGGQVYGAAQLGDLQLAPVFVESKGGEPDYTPDFVVTVPGVIEPEDGVVMRLMPTGERKFVAYLSDPNDETSSGDPDGMLMSKGSAAHAVLNVMLDEPLSLAPGGYVRALTIAAMHAHPLELRGIFARAYPALAEAVDLYKNSEDGLAVLRQRAGLAPEQERDAHGNEEH